MSWEPSHDDKSANLYQVDREYLADRKRLSAETEEPESAERRRPLDQEFKNVLLPALRAAAQKQQLSSAEYRDRLAEAEVILESMFNSLHCDDQPKMFWVHQRFDLFRTHDKERGFAILKDELSTVVTEYLKQAHLRTNRLDWISIDALVFAELEAYAHQMFITRGGTGTNWAAMFAQNSEGKYWLLSVVFWVLGWAMRLLAVPAMAYYLFIVGHEAWAMVVAAMWVLSIGFKLVTYPIRWRARRVASKLLKHLIGIYTLLGDQTISPRKLKESLDAAAAAGVVLDGAVFTIVDRALARDPTAFIPTQVEWQ